MRVDELFCQYLLSIPNHVLAGCASSFLSASFEVWRHKSNLKDSVMMIALAMATTLAMIEWFGIPWVGASMLIGLIAGRGADNLLRSIDATMPEFTDNLVRDMQLYLRKIIAKKMGFEMRDDAKTTEKIEQPTTLSNFKKSSNKKGK